MQTNPLFHEAIKLLHTAEIAPLHSGRRAGTLSPGEIDRELKTATEGLKLTPAVTDLIRGLAYLWHDHLEESHRISQEIESADGNLLHAMMHRREGDYSNAKYWFRRVGAHPSFLSLGTRAGELLEKARESDLQSRLLPNKMWDPFAFVDAVEDAVRGQFKSRVPLLEQLQKLEFECFFENLSNRV